jgi:hypothetical protein
MTTFPLFPSRRFPNICVLRQPSAARLGRLAAIQQQTAAVSAMLTEIFADEPPAAEGVSIKAISRGSVLSGLDDNLTSLSNILRLRG